MVSLVLYAITVSGLLAGAARIAERGLRHAKLPLRWVWTAALVGSLLAFPLGWLGRVPAEPVPAQDRLVLEDGSITRRTFGRDSEIDLGSGGGSPVAPLSESPSSIDGVGQVLDSEGPGGERAAGKSSTAASEPTRTSWVALRIGPWPGWLDVPLIVVWATVSSFLLLRLLLGTASLQRKRSKWSRERMGDRTVLVSASEGPAVLGVWRGEIVMPQWVWTGDPESARLILRHEEEHLAAHDSRLTALGTLAVTLFPWNPATWWIVRSLRQAVELDCDARVLASGVRLTEYGNLLVNFAAMPSRNEPALRPALAGPGSFLERRLRALFLARQPKWRRRVATSAMAASAGVILAVALPAPVVSAPASEKPAAGVEVPSLPLAESSPTGVRKQEATEVSGNIENGSTLSAIGATDAPQTVDPDPTITRNGEDPMRVATVLAAAAAIVPTVVSAQGRPEARSRIANDAERLACFDILYAPRSVLTSPEFIGGDPGAGPNDPRPNSERAAAAFDDAAWELGNVTVITFEAFPAGWFESSLEVAPGVTLSHTGTTPEGGVINGCFMDCATDVRRGYNVTLGGEQYLGVPFEFEVGTAAIDFAFETPIEAFGTYIIGLGTANGDVSLEFNRDGTQRSIPIPGDPRGGPQFVGFTAPGASIDRVRLAVRNVSGGSRDNFSLDDVRYTPAN